jgi:hypothetical protein
VNIERANKIRQKLGLPDLAASRPEGLGDKIAKIFTPIARVLKLPCVDPVTGKLRPESGCAKRRAALNKLDISHL